VGTINGAGNYGFMLTAIDGAINGVANGTVAAGRELRRLQTGQLQFYAMFIVLGLVAITVCYYIFA
jgi:NADH:ubiquinone oxidoreductase subunit 5 (subunit L)/multisubunit Na+/H+ antiporter MnhA subunit